jgi:hypothetical protein
MVDIKRQINSLVYLNLMSYSVLSGCGNCSMPALKDIEEIDYILDAVPRDKRPYNIYFANSLYKKCMPQYQVAVEDPYNFNNFKWKSKKSKKIIDIDVMANSIIGCCSLIERLLTFELHVENPNFIIYILQKTALNQAIFIDRYLKVGNVFYNGEDVTEGDGKEFHIQISSDNPDRASQLAVFHAISALVQISNYGLPFFHSHVEELFEDLNALPSFLTNSIDSIEESSTKELSQIGLHLVEIYKKSGCYTDIIHKFLHKIAKELCQRTKSNGKVLRNKGSEEISSPGTTANSLNLLSQLSYMFSSKSCNETCNIIYQDILTTWDEKGRVFKTRDSNKQSYSIKDLASIIAALFSYSRILQDANQYDNLAKQVASFTETSILKSSIFNNQCNPILQLNKMKLYDSQESDKSWAPVFNKAFEYKLSKNKYYCDADVFRADYVIPACAMLLNCINN